MKSAALLLTLALPGLLTACTGELTGPPRLDSSVTLTVTASTLAGCGSVVLKNPYGDNPATVVRENASIFSLWDVMGEKNVGGFTSQRDGDLALTTASTYRLSSSVIGTAGPVALRLTFQCSQSGKTVQKDLTLSAGSPQTADVGF